MSLKTTVKRLTARRSNYERLVKYLGILRAKKELHKRDAILVAALDTCISSIEAATSALKPHIPEEEN